MQPPPAQMAYAGQLNKGPLKRAKASAIKRGWTPCTLTRSIGGGVLLKKPIDERAPPMHWIAECTSHIAFKSRILREGEILLSHQKCQSSV